MEEPVLRKHTSLHVPAHPSLQVTPVNRLLDASPTHVKMMELALKDSLNLKALIAPENQGLTALKALIALKDHQGLTAPMAIIALKDHQGLTSLKHPTALNYAQLSLALVHQTI